MKKIFRGLLGIVLCSVIVCNAAPPAGNETKVTSHGVTDVAAAFGKTQVSIKITTHEVDIGKPSDPRPEKILSSCTYSRVPCSPVDYMEISVNGNTLHISRSVYADLADVGVASLRQKKKGQFVLTLSGGDASESYYVEITFDKNEVRQRELGSNLDGLVLERTTYFVLPPLDK
jgi:hypothetical protein